MWGEEQLAWLQGSPMQARGAGGQEGRVRGAGGQKQRKMVGGGRGAAQFRLLGFLKVVDFPLVAPEPSCPHAPPIGRPYWRIGRTRSQRMRRLRNPHAPPPYWQALLADRQDQVTEDAEALLIALPEKLLGMETVRVVGAVRAEGRGVGCPPDQLLGMETVRVGSSPIHRLRCGLDWRSDSCSAQHAVGQEPSPPPLVPASYVSEQSA